MASLAELIYSARVNDRAFGVISQRKSFLRTFARQFSNIDFFLKILPLKDDALVMSEM